MKKPKAAAKKPDDKKPEPPSMLPAIMGIRKSEVEEAFIQPTPPSEPPRPPMRRDALEEGYHALEVSRIEMRRDIKELSGDVGRLVDILGPFLGPKFTEDAKDILSRKQEPT